MQIVYLEGDGRKNQKGSEELKQGWKETTREHVIKSVTNLVSTWGSVLLEALGDAIEHAP